MNCNVAIHCTLVVRNVVIVGCAEPWFTHAVAIGAISCPSITRAEALQTVNEAQLLPNSIRCRHLFIGLQQLVLGTLRRDWRRRLSA
jgi:hypothetical protein